MSYDINLLDPVTKNVIQLDEPHQLHGGTYAVGGTKEAWLNVTYNYGEHFRSVLGDKGIRLIYGMSGASSLPVLEKAISSLKDDVSSDYWAPTEGNAKAALAKLKSLAQMRPDGIWDGD